MGKKKQRRQGHWHSPETFELSASNSYLFWSFSRATMSLNDDGRRDCVQLRMAVMGKDEVPDCV